MLYTPWAKLWVGPWLPIPGTGICNSRTAPQWSLDPFCQRSLFRLMPWVFFFQNWWLLAFISILVTGQRCGLFWSKLACVITCPLGLGNLIGIWFWVEFLEEWGVHVVMWLQALSICLQKMEVWCRHHTQTKLQIHTDTNPHLIPLRKAERISTSFPVADLWAAFRDKLRKNA